MSSLPTPVQILETLLPHLRVAAAYSRQIQTRIAARPSKDAENHFGAALSDADLSIQTLVEVALLGSFPHLRFYGEEHKQSYNTKYFRAIDLGPKDDYLVTLDPIDGTRFYLDGHSNYQIILTVLNTDEYEAAIALTPAENTYTYALRGQGCWQGSLEMDLKDCQPLKIDKTPPTILLGWGMERLKPLLETHYTVLDVATSYSKERQIPNVNGMLNGELCGAMIRAGNFIDGAALAFMVQEAGGIVTTFDGSPPPPLYTSTNYRRPGLLLAASPTVHAHLLEAAQTIISTQKL